MKYVHTLIDETGIPEDVTPGESGGFRVLYGTVTRACGHRESAGIGVVHPALQALFFEAHRHYVCLDCYTGWHRRWHTAAGDWHSPTLLYACKHDLHPQHYWGGWDTERDISKAQRICAAYAERSLYPEYPEYGERGTA